MTLTHTLACSLSFTLWSTIVIWNLFWVAWVVARCGGSLAPMAEPLTIFCNFAAKVCGREGHCVAGQGRCVAGQGRREGH